MSFVVCSTRDGSSPRPKIGQEANLESQILAILIEEVAIKLYYKMFKESAFSKGLSTKLLRVFAPKYFL